MWLDIVEHIHCNLNQGVNISWSNWASFKFNLNWLIKLHTTFCAQYYNIFFFNMGGPVAPPFSQYRDHAPLNWLINWIKLNSIFSAPVYIPFWHPPVYYSSHTCIGFYHSWFRYHSNYCTIRTPKNLFRLQRHSGPESPPNLAKKITL